MPWRARSSRPAVSESMCPASSCSRMLIASGWSSMPSSRASATAAVMALLGVFAVVATPTFYLAGATLASHGPRSCERSGRRRCPQQIEKQPTGGSAETERAEPRLTSSEDGTGVHFRWLVPLALPSIRWPGGCGNPFGSHMRRSTSPTNLSCEERLEMLAAAMTPKSITTARSRGPAPRGTRISNWMG